MKLSNKNKNNDPILEYWIAFDLHMKFLYFKILQNNLFVRVDPVFQSVRVNPVFQSVRVDPVFLSVRVNFFLSCLRVYYIYSKLFFY